MKVRYNVPKRIVLSVAVLTVESAKRALETVSVSVRGGTLLRSAQRTGVTLEVILSLGLFNRVQ